jgi:hypothetical protein
MQFKVLSTSISAVNSKIKCMALKFKIHRKPILDVHIVEYEFSPMF